MRGLAFPLDWDFIPACKRPPDSDPRKTCQRSTWAPAQEFATPDRDELVHALAATLRIQQSIVHRLAVCPQHRIVKLDGTRELREVDDVAASGRASPRGSPRRAAPTVTRHAASTDRFRGWYPRRGRVGSGTATLNRPIRDRGGRDVSRVRPGRRRATQPVCFPTGCFQECSGATASAALKI